MKQFKIDPRYTIALEWCGYIKQRHVIRFCNDWIDQAESRQQALELIELHNKTRFAGIA